MLKPSEPAAQTGAPASNWLVPWLLLSIGSVVLVSALVLLTWNEQRDRRQESAYHQIRSVVAPTPTGEINDRLEGRAVHLQAQARSDLGIYDPFFSMPSDGIALYRQVQMYQWVERAPTNSTDATPTITFSYEKQWDTAWHDSSLFSRPLGHENPKPKIHSELLVASDATIGPFRVNSTEIFERALAQAVDGQLGDLGPWASYADQLPPLLTERRLQGWSRAAVDEYHWGDERAPEIGDLSVVYYQLGSPYWLSLIGRQQGNQIVPWTADNGEQVHLAVAGRVDAQQMLDNAIARTAAPRGQYRLVGAIGAALGMLLIAASAAWRRAAVGQRAGLSLLPSALFSGLLLSVAAAATGWFWQTPPVASSLIALSVGCLTAGLYRWGEMRPVAGIDSHPKPERSANSPTYETRRPPAGGELIRRMVGRKGDYTVTGVLRRKPSGEERLLCFELHNGASLVERGSKAQIRAALNRALTSIN